MWGSNEDWATVLEQLLEGDRLALMKMTRLIDSCLTRWNAYDFRDEWRELIQEVVLSTTIAMREGKLGDGDAVVAHVRQATRSKLTAVLRTQLDVDSSQPLPWEGILTCILDAPSPGHAEDDIRRALEALSDEQRTAVVQCRVLTMSVAEAVRNTASTEAGLAQDLHEGLAALRIALAPRVEAT